MTNLREELEKNQRQTSEKDKMYLELSLKGIKFIPHDSFLSAIVCNSVNSKLIIHDFKD